MRRWIPWVCTAVAAATLVEAAIVSTHHLASPDFPPHARFHALIGGLFLAALAVVCVLLAWSPLADRRVRAALVLVLFAMPSAPLVAALLVPGGGPPPFDRALALGGVVVAAAVALLLRPRGP